MPQNPAETEEKTIFSASKPETWENAWMASPGPVTYSAPAILFLKGFCMGTADIVPGVSGGTTAL